MMWSSEVVNIIILGVGGAAGALLAKLLDFLLASRKTQADRDTAIEAAKIAHLAEMNAADERRRNAEIERMAKGYEQMLAAANATLGDCKTENAKLLDKIDILETHIDVIEKHNVACEIKVASLTERVLHLESTCKDLRAQLDNKMPKAG